MPAERSEPAVPVPGEFCPRCMGAGQVFAPVTPPGETTRMIWLSCGACQAGPHPQPVPGP